MKKNSLSHDFDVLAPYYDWGLKILLFPFGGEARLRKRIAHFLQCEDLTKGSKILEIGCGTGSNLKGIDKRCPGCFELVGIDSSMSMLKEARRNRYDSKVKFLFGDAAGLPFAEESFESVLAVLTLHEMTDEKRRKAVSEMYRVVKRGGCILVVDFSYSNSFIGRVLFGLLGIIENKEALEFAKVGFDFLLSPFNLEKKNEVLLYQGLVKFSLYGKH